MIKIIFEIFACVIIFFSSQAFAIENAAPFVQVKIELQSDESAHLSMIKIGSDFRNSDIEFRSKTKTDWQIIILNKSEKKITAGFLKFRDAQINLQGASASSVSEGHPTQGSYSEYEAYFVFKLSKESYKIELMKNGKLKAKAFISDLQ
ncbi:MAG: hypothetical protein ACXVAX_05645 [Pseudobdellovibrio sp.]